MLIVTGLSYYNLPLEERFFHPDYTLLKPGGGWGHGYGVAGSLCMIFGILLYAVRKRVRALGRLGTLKGWLEFHIFLCTLGPILVLFHTSFKFGGLVAVSFWSMVAVFASGIIGRYIYIQIPRTIEGRELSLSEVREMKTSLGSTLTSTYKLDEASYSIIEEATKKRVELYHSNALVSYIKGFMKDRKTIRSVKKVLNGNQLTRGESKKIMAIVKQELSINRKIDRLITMQKLFRYWHVAHFPFAIVMIVIMLIHAAVTIALGYRWIF